MLDPKNLRESDFKEITLILPKANRSLGMWDHSKKIYQIKFKDTILRQVEADDIFKCNFQSDPTGEPDVWALTYQNELIVAPYANKKYELKIKYIPLLYDEGKIPGWMIRNNLYPSEFPKK